MVNRPSEPRLRRACRERPRRSLASSTLQVPTGGGKDPWLRFLFSPSTCARTHGLRRVVYVAPFTSNHRAERRRLPRRVPTPRGCGAARPGGEASTATSTRQVDRSKPSEPRRTGRLPWSRHDARSSSNELCSAHRSSRCRKLHNLSRAVVVLDEGPVTSVDLLAPCLRALEALSRDYGTASCALAPPPSPQWHARSRFGIGTSSSGPGPRLLPDPPSGGLFRALKAGGLWKRRGPLSERRSRGPALSARAGPLQS